MRSHQLGSSSRRVGSDLRLSPLPMEWLDAGSWRMPSGKALAEFALQAGFLAPLILKTERLDKPANSLEDHGGTQRSKHFGKGSSR
ncbi:MAG TPA: hypothetical protein VMH80_01250 [Bryobacteraceae bacterium]|nr:hypothetical protein [Bryobacteraceae bacterium]